MELTPAHVKVLVKTCKEHLVREGEEARRSEMVETRITPKLVDSYLEPLKPVEDLSYAFKRLAYTLQSRNMLPQVIDLDNRPKECFCDFNLNKFTRRYKTIRQFRQAVRKSCGVNVDGQCWKTFLNGLWAGARWLSQFEDFHSFKRFLKAFSDHGAEGVEILVDALGDGRIPGMREALALEFIKEIGLPISRFCCKPDTHVVGLIKALGLCPGRTDPMSAWRKVRGMADLAGMTPYGLDRLMWLACSGHFFRDDERLWEPSDSARHRKEIVREVLKQWKGIPRNGAKRGLN